MLVPDEGVEVDRREAIRDKLAVHPVHDTTVARDDRVKVLEVVGALDSRRIESSERRYNRSEDGKPEGVQLN
ncbi:unnamed protein product [Phytophthora lilii]|uniref:Unnamed protein product n=1 Tax=Phytophthora lilii TaxID=2077276 RepID=A0A9W6TDW8_9STRA|nr:unnamed protein product [Phytophthora lilii]